MIESIITSSGIGLIGGIVITGLWVYFQYYEFTSICKRVIEKVIIKLKNEESETSDLSKLCTQDFIDKLTQAQEKILEIQRIFSISNFKIRIVRNIDNNIRIIVDFNILHENGRTKAQAIIHRSNQNILLQNLLIF